MPNLGRALHAIKSRRQRSPLVRALYVVVLRLWKLARRLPFSQRVCVTLPVAGHRLRVRLFSYDDLLVASPDYEVVLNQWLPPVGGVVVDSGAFIGRHTLQYARAVGPAGRVVAVEPFGENFRLLESNVRRNGYDQVTPVCCALGAANGEVTLFFERESSTATTLRPQSASAPRTTIVPLRTLDTVLGELDITRVDMLKIDVEGAELSVLRGAERTLRASPAAVLIIEMHGSPLANCPVHAWLSEREYQIEEAFDGARRFYHAAREVAPATRPALHPAPHRSRHDRLGRR